MPEDTNTTAATTAPATTEVKKEEKVVQKPVHAFDITRNEVVFPIMMFVKTRGDNKDQPYLRTDTVTKENKETFLKWLGDDMLLSILNAKMALAGSNITEQATPEKGEPNEGVLNQELAQKYFEELNTRGESKSDLEEKRDDVLKQMIAASTDATLDMTARVELIQKLGAEANALGQAIENKSRERKPKAPVVAPAGSPVAN